MNIRQVAETALACFHPQMSACLAKILSEERLLLATQFPLLVYLAECQDTSERDKAHHKSDQWEIAENCNPAHGKNSVLPSIERVGKPVNGLAADFIWVTLNVTMNSEPPA